MVLRREWKRTCLGSSFPGLFELWNVERVDGFDDRRLVRDTYVILSFLIRNGERRGTTE